MANLLAYIREMGHLSFSERPFGATDSLALTQIVYMPMEGLFPSDGPVTVADLSEFLIREYPDDRFADFFQRKRCEFSKFCGETARFAGLPILDYYSVFDPEKETQFCACTFVLPNGDRFIAFRGTDLTVTGWKEDLNMSFEPVPAQAEAVRYVERAAAAFSGSLLLGGHSKGGHLSLYAAAHAAPEVQARILSAYSFDGPGVDEATLGGEGYARVKERVESYIPQSSVVGMLLCYHPVYTVVKSSTIGLLQHDALSWQVKNGEFETLHGLDLSTRITDEALRKWIDGLTLDDRRMLTETVFRIISAIDSENLDPLVQDFTGSSLKMLGAVRRLEPERRADMRRIMHELYASGAGEAVRMLLYAVVQRAAESPVSPVPLVERMKTRQQELLEKLKTQVVKTPKDGGEQPTQTN
ncbi:MAG: DUF2974 domain-containing protein [Eubacteriales bacterium]|nr:DUF2974 domain-containing protein [Eubacteriales bacterium]